MIKRERMYPEKKIVSQVENQRILEKRQEQILHAAGPLFAKKGYHSTTTREIAAAASINNASLYKYVSSKDDILYLFWIRIHSQWTEHLIPILNSENEHPTESLKKFIETALETCLKINDEIRTLFTESRHLDKDSLQAVLSAESGFIEAIETLVKRGVDAGCFKCKDTFIAAGIIQYLVMFYSLRGWSLKHRYTFSGVVELVTDHIFKALGVEEVDK